MNNERNHDLDTDLDLDSILEGDYGPAGDYTLESILAEFKGSAFMDGDKRTPSQELQRKTDEILREALGKAREPVEETPAYEEPEPEEPSYEATALDPEPDEPEEEEEIAPKRPIFSLFRRRERSVPEIEKEPKDDEEPEPPLWEAKTRPEPETAPEPAYETAPEIDLSFFDEPEEPSEKSQPFADFLDDLDTAPESLKLDDYVYSSNDVSQIADEIEEAIAAGSEDLEEPFFDDGEEEDEEERPSLFAGLLARLRGMLGDEELVDENGERPDFIDDDDFYQEDPVPDSKREAQRYAARIPSLRLRILGAAVLCVLMLLMTYMCAAGKAIPFGIGTLPALVTGMLLILELIVMGLGIDVLTRGLEDILTFSPGVESLVFVSCAASVLDGFSMLLRGSFGLGVPFALISAVSLLVSMIGRMSYYIAMCDSLRASVASSSAHGVVADMEGIQGRRILKKVAGARDGFYTKLTAPDISESAYDRAAPLLVIVSFVLAFLASVGHGNAAGFAHTFSLFTAVSAAFPAAAIFSLPFRYVAASAKKIGSAIAGWEGAQDIYYTDGALITDGDIYPTGSVTLSGQQLVPGMNERKVTEDAATLLIASDSALRRVFEELLRHKGFHERRLESFASHDGGGLSAVIEGERVLVGTGAFMNLMGIRFPENLNTTSSVFVAINDAFAGVYSLNYTPANSVQSALASLLNTRTNLLMAVRDFNITPNNVKQKFKVSMDGVEYLPIETTYEVTRQELPKGGGVSAILCRGGLAPFAEVITKGRLLKLITEISTVFTLAGTALSLLIMFFLAWAGAFAAASCGNVFLFMAILGAAVFVLSLLVRRHS